MAQPVSLRSDLIQRLLWWIVPIVIAGMTVHWIFERSLLRNQFDASLLEKATTLATLVTEKEGRFELEFADEYMPQYSRETHPFFFQIWTPDGEVLERSYSLRGEDLPLVRGSLASPAVFETTLARGNEVRCIGVEFPLRLGTDQDVNPATSVTIVLGADTYHLNQSLKRGVLEVGATGVASVLGVSIAVLLALRKGVRLLERVAEDVSSITPSSLSRPLDEDQAPVEIRPIVASLNRALETLRAFVERERRFNSDVAHELRTPIAELRAAADVALKWPDAESKDRLAVHAGEIAAQMAGLVESLLELATLESSDAGETEEAFDLGKCAALAVDQAQRGEQDGRTIELELDQDVILACDPKLWEVVLRNLLDNALSYSPAGSRITVRVRRDGEGAAVRVSNRTDALDEAGVARCTDRLWRATRSPVEASHFGLGLSIVQAASAKLGHNFAVRLEHGVFHASLWKTGRDAPKDAR